GFFMNPVSNLSDFAVIRLNSNGGLDTRFDKDGKAIYDFGGSEEAHGMALDKNGRIVLAGVTYGSTVEFQLARINTATPISTAGVFEPNTATWSLRTTNTSGSPNITPFTFGGANWLPVVGDWNGDGKTTIGAVDPSTMTWHLRDSNNSGGSSITPFTFGGKG